MSKMTDISFIYVPQMYVLCKNPLPMDVEFMLSDSIEVSTSALCLLREADVAVRL